MEGKSFRPVALIGFGSQKFDGQSGRTYTDHVDEGNFLRQELRMRSGAKFTCTQKSAECKAVSAPEHELILMFERGATDLVFFRKFMRG